MSRAKIVILPYQTIYECGSNQYMHINNPRMGHMNYQKDKETFEVKSL